MSFNENVMKSLLETYFVIKRWPSQYRSITTFCFVVNYMLAVFFEYNSQYPEEVLVFLVSCFTAALIYFAQKEVAKQQISYCFEPKKNLYISIPLLYLMAIDLGKTTTQLDTVKCIKYLELCLLLSYLWYGITMFVSPPIHFDENVKPPSFLLRNNPVPMASPIIRDYNFTPSSRPLQDSQPQRFKNLVPDHYCNYLNYVTRRQEKAPSVDLEELPRSVPYTSPDFGKKRLPPLFRKKYLNPPSRDEQYFPSTPIKFIPSDKKPIDYELLFHRRYGRPNMKPKGAFRLHSYSKDNYIAYMRSIYFGLL